MSTTGELGLGAIDSSIVLAYIGIVLVLGTWYGRRVHTASDFFVAGKSLPFWAIGMSIVVSDIGATDFIAVAGGTYKYGLAQANFDWLGSMPALLIAGGQAVMAAGDAGKGKQVYMVNCIACHNLDPSKDGAIGPANKGASRALVEARVLRGKYPKGYKPKRTTKLMPPLPHLKPHIDDLTAFLNQ